MVNIQEEEALKDQDLSNALADTDWVKAIQLAFELRRPFRVLKVFEDLLRYCALNFLLFGYFIVRRYSIGRLC